MAEDKDKGKDKNAEKSKTDVAQKPAQKKEAGPHLSYPYQLEAPREEPGTNWREYFYNEVAPVKKRVAYVRRTNNAKELIRRKWKLVKGTIPGAENKPAPKPDPKPDEKPAGDKKEKKPEKKGGKDS